MQSAVYMLKFVKTQGIASHRGKLYSFIVSRLAAHSALMYQSARFWIKDTCSYHCVMKSVPMVKIGAVVRLTSLPFRLLSVPFISIPPNRGGSNLQSYCALSSSVPSHLSDILKDWDRMKIYQLFGWKRAMYLGISHFIFGAYAITSFFYSKIRSRPPFVSIF